QPEKESQETSDEAEQPNTIPIVEPLAEANEEKTTEEILEENINNEVDATEKGKTESLVSEVEPTETGKEEPVVTVVEENQKEPEQLSTETNDVVAVEEKTRELETEAAPLKETNVDEVGPTETEAEPVVTVVDENHSELGIQSIKQEEEEKPKEEAEIQEQIGDIVEVHPPKDSDIEVVKEIDNSESEVIPVSNGVAEKEIEPLQVGEEVVETIKEVEPKQATEKSEGSLDDTIKEEESETKTTVNTAEVSLNEETQTNPANLVEPSPEVEEKVVVEDGKKESSFTDVIEGVSSKEVVGVTENATSVEEKAVVAAEDEKKEPEAPDAVQVSSREAEVDIKKTDEQNEAKTATPEVGDADKKVDEISKA
ncbi:enolase-phosphatase E1-like, partial [Trifolium medium]|nr:enolase-phosphatase E1-like [Trifolium medium]